MREPDDRPDLEPEGFLRAHRGRVVRIVYRTGGQAAGRVEAVGGAWVYLRNDAGLGSLCALDGILAVVEEALVSVVHGLPAPQRSAAKPH